jgi:hypothetical protein
VDSGESLALAVVWIEVLPSDDAEAAALARGLFHDARVTQFHDPEQHAGRAVAEALGVEDIAWDVYLLYGPGAKWDEPAPAPRAWFHQLDGSKADEARRRSGHGLAVSLHEAGRTAGFPLADRSPGAEAFTAARKRALEHLRASTGGDVRCATCKAAGRLSSCSLGEWTRLLARSEGDGKVIVSGHEPPSPAGGRREIRLRLTGMLCPECMLRAATGPIGLDGLDELEVLLEVGEMRVLLGWMTDIDAADLVEAVREQGFGAEVLPEETAPASGGP